MGADTKFSHLMKIVQVCWVVRRVIQDQEDLERDVFFPEIEFEFKYKVVEKPVVQYNECHPSFFVRVPNYRKTTFPDVLQCSWILSSVN